MKYIYLAILAAIVFIFVPESYAAGKFTVQVGSFKTDENAQDLISKLKDAGYSCETGKISGLVKVYCGEFDSKDEASALSVTLKAKGFRTAFVTAMPSDLSKTSSSVSDEESEVSVPPVGTPPVVAPAVAAAGVSTAVLPETSGIDEGATSDEQMEASEEGEVSEEGLATGNKLASEVEAREKDYDDTVPGTISGDVLENGGQYIHPFLSLTGVYTDNVYNVNEDQDAEDDFIYIVSPGFWVTVPPTGIEPAQTPLSIGSPGGANLTKLKEDSGRKFNAHLYYRGDAEEYTDHHSEDSINHTADGEVSYDTLHGIYISLADQYVKSHEDRGTTIDDGKNLYTNNRARGTLVFGKGRRISLALGYTVYNVDFDDDANAYRERYDRKYSGYAFLRMMPKTSLFGGCEYAIIDYDENVFLPDSTERGCFAGVTWNITGKTSGILRGGRNIKKFDEDSNLDDESASSGEAQIVYTPTSKTQIRISGARTFKESNMQTSPYVISETGHFELDHRLSHKITANLVATYTKDVYSGEVRIGTEIAERTDKIGIVNVSLKWDISKLNSVTVGYINKQRDSNFDVLDYKVNMGFLRFTATL